MGELNKLDMTKKENSRKNIDSKEFMDDRYNPFSDSCTECEETESDKVTDLCEENDDKSAEMSEEQSDADEWRDKYLRLSAEFDNYRKRTLKEKANLAVMGGEMVIKAILPVLDDVDRALEAVRSSDDIESVRSGVELISTKMKDTLKSQGLKEIEAIGLELDTDFHEAVATTPAPEKKSKGRIIDVAQKGYSYKDKVIRHSKVVVGE